VRFDDVFRLGFGRVVVAADNQEYVLFFVCHKVAYYTICKQLRLSVAFVV
jgi:hypothetical protein